MSAWLSAITQRCLTPPLTHAQPPPPPLYLGPNRPYLQPADSRASPVSDVPVSALSILPVTQNAFWG